MDAGWLVAALLLSIRLGALALMAPPLGGAMVPPTVRVAVVLGWAAVLAAGIPAASSSVTTLPSSPETGVPALGPLLAAAASEAALGMVMALGLNLAFAVFSFGARLVDVQIGFGMGQVFDPMTRQQLPVLSAVFTQLALVGFFLLDGHHALLRGVALSLEVVPPGHAWALGPLLPAVVRQAGQMFSLGFAMVAPVVFCLTLVELGLGVLSRNLPQMNTLVVGVPIKVVVGLSALGLWAVGSGTVMQRAYASTFSMWGALWR
ncbi:flagellar biosynthetic protein FliR [Ideonella sp. YS5]|uniref:flagellar biosynthetic protein FliR n=1 Tax=Ideonella sp. YS5 TaxID=3453714 RepID=UPI003EEBD01E